MSKKRLAVFVFLLFAAILSNYLVIEKIQPDAGKGMNLEMTVNSNEKQTYQIYYSEDEVSWSELNSSSAEYSKTDYDKTIQLPFSQGTKYIRLDFGMQPASHFIRDISIKCNSDSMMLDMNKVIMSDMSNMLVEFESNTNSISVKTEGTDPYIVLNLSEMDLTQFVLDAQEDTLRINKIILCVAIDILLIGCFLFLSKFASLPLEVYRNRKLVMNLAKNDFKTKYAGSYLGIIWAFVQPIVTIAVYSFVFQVGFRSGAVMDCPFVLWLMAGLVPWFFFSDALNGGTSSLLEYSYLVKKVVFKISVIPIVKIISALFVHIFFVAITIILFAIFGYYPTLYTLQVVYYSACMFIFVLALTYITCSVIIFFRDLGQVIAIILQVGIWMTPIMWQETMLPENLRWIMKLNPVYYVVNGYREALIDHRWFWQNPNQLVYFWFVTAVLFAFGCIVFKRLKVHFADVL